MRRGLVLTLLLSGLPLLGGCPAADDDAPIRVGDLIDQDGDGFFVNNPTAAEADCDDDPIDGAKSFPGAAEICDGKDNDCNGEVDDDPQGGLEYWPDDDEDGFGRRVDEPLISCRLPPGFSPNRQDCNDDDPSVFPGAPERCNGADDNCNLDIDEGFDPSAEWYTDVDRDGFGGAKAGEGCATDPSWVRDATDCNDINSNINPEADEICDGIDNDCDGIVDASDDDVVGTRTWYEDVDRDGYGTLLSTLQVCASDDARPAFVPNGDDCNDADARQNPDTEWFRDADRDGFGTESAPMWPTPQCWQPLGYAIAAGDCNDADPTAWETRIWYADADRDGFGSPFAVVQGCGQQPGMVSNDLDCDDRRDDVNPEALEICNGGIDDDCDGGADDDDPEEARGKTTFWADADGDGFGVFWLEAELCSDPGDFATQLGDCDDENADVNPDTVWYADADRDGFGDPAAPFATPQCEVVPGHVPNADDCDDGDFTLNADTPWWRDRDRDGVGISGAPTQFGCIANPIALSTEPGDCNDNDPTDDVGGCFGSVLLGDISVRLEMDDDALGVVVTVDCGTETFSRPLDAGDAGDVIRIDSPDTLDFRTTCTLDITGPDSDLSADGFPTVSVTSCTDTLLAETIPTYPYTATFDVSLCSGCTDPDAFNVDEDVLYETNATSCIFLP